MYKKIIIARIKGGLGNQLFCYAAARRLALMNNAQLIIDDITGFVRDRLYKRKYMLDHFLIPVRKAKPIERLEPFERYRRAFLKWINKRKPFFSRSYLEQEGIDFDERILTFRVKKRLYLDGLWQSERYFKDIEQIIRNDLRIIPPSDELNQKMAQDINNNNSVAIHMRWFNEPSKESKYNISSDYYMRAISIIEQKSRCPKYFVFSDNIGLAQSKLILPENKTVLVLQNKNSEDAYADLWLMTQCKHFITANSTFSWWGAWLGSQKGKIVVTPVANIKGDAAWGFSGLIPPDWVKI